ncbi:conserved hypothetical protein [Halorhabdus utahensis DSM 12940]|uniref:Uncharacterized protein n=1 Tax=Halorhabdus utahensis (strain DSM 12940 / JCM 11049 / AX-2) TaxID=519442 RepID=C7NQV3_HALUD|nr:hypothetical protein [Halorhabdus utahensis]ACV11857.1 conserved hypothetical protein [Halorhabdus utahensis DSM 12940]
MTENTHSSTEASLSITNRIVRHLPLRHLAIAAIALFVLAEPAAAQGSGQAFCNTPMADTIQNVFTLIQFGGPMLGGVLALGATVALPFVRRSDWKKEMKGIRNQGLLWGVIVAPLGTEIITFILNNVVAGGSACAF